MSSLIVEVCKVNEVTEHPNADRLSIVTIKGFNCIVGLDNYKVGDLVVFVPPDCIIPAPLIEKYELDYLKNNGRTGTVKLRGYISQGLILDVPSPKYKEGDNVAEVMGITKYEVAEPSFAPQPKKSSRKKLNPNFDKYTDIENIKHYPDVFTSDDVVVVTEKLHGCNMRAANLEISINRNQPLLSRTWSFIRKNLFRQKYEFVYGSHNVQIGASTKRRSFYGTDVWGQIAKKYNLREVIPQDYIIYGEIYGPGIQDLTYGTKEIDFAVFDIKYKGQYLPWGTNSIMASGFVMNEQLYFPLNSVKALCAKWGLPTVPEIYVGPYLPGIVQADTSGKSLLCPTQMREGIVIKLLHEGNSPQIGRKILKSVSEDYLLRKNGTEFK
jgi:RNA ligase (TIGR02306 family)